MRFRVLPHGRRSPAGSRNIVFLLTDNWDDWFKYSTLYGIIYYDNDGEKHDLGGVKIGQFNMTKDQRRADLPEQFEQLDNRFFSLGQDADYYKYIHNFGPDVKEDILIGLKDVVWDRDLYRRAAHEDVMGVSLLRSVTEASIKGQFRRIITGDAPLSQYEFGYIGPAPGRQSIDPVEVMFKVTPDSKPPTNIHVLIGRNGVGKTYLLNAMTRAVVRPGQDEDADGFFGIPDRDDLVQPDESLFANIVSVTFSAFDPFEPLPEKQNVTDAVRYSYIGLKRKLRSGATDSTPSTLKDHKSMGTEFSKSARLCVRGARAERWRRALNTLASDPIFQAANIVSLTEEESEDEMRKQASAIFSRLSSGHKIVLLTVTRLVEKVEERTLVILDEPEAHLHPPLLSAFVRALSDLLINRNGVAIIATHSPVVLQEVPKNCVWKISRQGRIIKATRPRIETFAENIGVLTREIFGLEVTDSGFHRMLIGSVGNQDDYDDVLKKFDNEVGSEGRSLVSSEIAIRDDEGDD